MKDLPVSTLLPIMLETAEWSSDAEEMADGESTGQQRDTFPQHPNSHRECCTQHETADGVRRSSSPGSTLRRHFHNFKLRRKTSAPCVPPPDSSLANSRQLVNPLASMTGTPLIDLLEKLRPRHMSTTDSGIGSMPASITVRADSRRRSIDGGGGNSVSAKVDEGFHSISTDDPFWKPLFVDTKLANATSGIGGGPATVPRRCLYHRQASLMGGGEEEARYQGQRQRCNSEAGRYLLVRKCSEVGGGSEFVGRLETEWAYCQILATMKCCDLMPPLVKMVVLDSELTIRKAFRALVENNLRAAPIWDSRQHAFVGLLTATDLIRMLTQFCLVKTKSASEDGDHCEGSKSTSVDSNRSYCSDSILETGTAKKVPEKTFDDMLSSALHQRPITQGAEGLTAGNKFNNLVYIYADESVAKAAKYLCDRRLHRLVVLDHDRAGNALFMLSKKDILKALKIYIAKLPLPVCMERTLDDLMIGTWNDLVAVTPQTTLQEALALFVTNGLSALPVVNDCYHILDMLTKVDIMNLVVDNRGPVDSVLAKTVGDATNNRSVDVEKMTTCSKKATLLLAVERLLYSDAHRLAIVDSDGKLEGVLAMADLMRFLTSGFL